jgi:hypothetical protein
LGILLLSCSNEQDYFLAATEDPVEENKVAVKECFIDLYEALSIANQFLDSKQGAETRASGKERVLRETSIIQSDKKVRSSGAVNDTFNVHL